jgi:nitroreductase
MMLAATALGVGSCWINQLHWLDSHAAVRDFLGANCGLEENETVCGGLALGYPAREDALQPASRPTDRVDFVN